MTSSSSKTNNQTPLTNFSIESIMGGNLGPGSGSNSPTSDHIQIGPSQTNQLTTTTANNNQQQPNNKSHSQEQARVVKAKKFRPKNFPCSACKMAFSNNGQLKNHLRIHTGERPFCCNQLNCNKTFTRNEELTRHKLIHTGVRPHTCNSCGKKFGRKDHLKKHVRTHDRKRYKKRLFAPSAQRLIKGEPSREAPNSLVIHNQANQIKGNFDAFLTSANNFGNPNHRIQVAPEMRPISSSQPASSLLQFPNNIMDAIQQMASDYWARFYNSAGICQQSHQVDLFGQRIL